jgi:hypothetical protein
MDRHRSYYEVEMTDSISCPCGWSGTVFDGFEPYGELYDVRCEECNRMLLIVSYPTVEETKEAAAAGNPRAIKGLAAALRVERFRVRFEAHQLRSPDELPELEGESLAFAWDFEGAVESDDDRWTVIRLGERVVWREPAVYEGAWRFEEVKAILKERYGARFASLTPTEASEYYLLGDRGQWPSTT